MKICECITCDSFVLTGASVFALINSSIRRYLCGITQLKLNEAIVLVKKLNEAIVLVRPLRQNSSPNEAKQLAQRGELQQTVNNSPNEATKLFFNMGVTIEQYRARIGTHNNFVKTKEGTSHLGGILWNTMPILNLLYWSIFLIGYIVYVALLLRMANDVEENPGPTVLDIIYPSETNCADVSQGNTRQFGQNAGKQCVAMSLTAIIHTQVKDITTWDASFLNTAQPAK